MLRSMFWRLRAPTESERRDTELQLVAACKDGDTESVRRLLERDQADANARGDDGVTALLAAVLSDRQIEIVPLLLCHDVDVNAASGESRKTPLFYTGDQSPVTGMLLVRGADPNARANDGATPLHFAVLFGDKQKVSLLLKYGAFVDAVNNAGHAPIHVLLLEVGSMSVSGAVYHDIAQYLVSFGAKWDDTCDRLIDNDNTLSSGFRVALHWWIDEHARGAEELTNIPEEVLLRGPDSVRQYLAARHASGRVIHRRRVCVVGSSFWGKTSLIKSILEGKPSLEHLEDRTIGVDQFRLVFCDQSQSEEELLMEACLSGDVEAVGWLVGTDKIRSILVRANADGTHYHTRRFKETKGLSPLHCAVKGGHLAVVQCLLHHGVNPNIKQAEKLSTPLHLAVEGNNERLVKALLSGGADPNATDADLSTPLHLAVFSRNAALLKVLLSAGADPSTKSGSGRTPLQGIISDLFWSFNHRAPILGAFQSIAQVLVAYGVTWDTQCENILTARELKVIALAFREAVMVWTEERAQGTELTSFPFETYRVGPAGIRQYLANSQVPSINTPITIDHSQGGQLTETALLSSASPAQNCGQRDSDSVSSLQTCAAARVSPAISTEENDSIEELNFIPRHEVTFWDFAGQEAYQVAHSAFFSKRTLYLVCVDLQSYAVAREQAEFRADKDSDFDRFVDEFVESKILRWIRLILASQPDAEFVFVGTKADVMRNTPHRIDKCRDDLAKRIKCFAMSIKSKSCDVDNRLQRLHLHTASTRSPGLQDTQFSRALDASAERLLNLEWLTVNCMDEASTKLARKAIEQIIIRSQRSFQMPDQYSQVLDAITERREGLGAKRPSDQVAEALMPISVATEYLKTRSPGLTNSGCQVILRTLHDIGDVLWFEDLGIAYLKESVVIHPLILIELVRQVVHHNRSSEVMTHAELKEMPFWDDLEPEQMLVIKQLLQHFHLVHPTGLTMKADSDMIVPVLWRSKESAMWLFLGDLLPNDPTLHDIQKDLCVRWEYHFTTSLPDVLFDQLVIESYLSQYDRHVGPDWILYKEGDQFACRIVVTRADRSLERVLRLEAVAATSATEAMWGRFEHLCESLERVLSRYQGLVVSRFVVDDKGRSFGLEDFVDEWMRTPSRRRDAKCWLPPSLDWYSENVMGASRAS